MEVQQNINKLLVLSVVVLIFTGCTGLQRSSMDISIYCDSTSTNYNAYACKRAWDDYNREAKESWDRQKSN